MKPRSKRLLLLAGAASLLVGAVALVLTAFQENLVFFHTPSEVAAGKAPSGRSFRVGGMVEEGSIKRQPDGLTVSFVITDMAQTVPVSYRGTLPDLFQEGKGAVVQGQIGPDGRFTATEVLAKHDENYMPVEAQYALDSAKMQKAAESMQQ